jgi:hypothetical protein
MKQVVFPSFHTVSAVRGILTFPTGGPQGNKSLRQQQPSRADKQFYQIVDVSLLR